MPSGPIRGEKSAEKPVSLFHIKFSQKDAILYHNPAIHAFILRLCSSSSYISQSHKESTISRNHGVYTAELTSSSSHLTGQGARSNAFAFAKREDRAETAAKQVDAMKAIRIASK
jgi:hypothetical protein